MIRKDLPPYSNFGKNKTAKNWEMMRLLELFAEATASSCGRHLGDGYDAACRYSI